MKKSWSSHYLDQLELIEEDNQVWIDQIKVCFRLFQDL